MHECIVKNASSAGHCEKGFVSKEITKMHIFDGYVKNFSASLVGNVETKQIRVHEML